MTRNTPPFDDAIDDLFNSMGNNVVPLRPAPRPAAANFVPAAERAVPPPEPYRPHNNNARSGGRRSGRVLGVMIEEWVHEHRAESEWLTEKARVNEERRGTFTFPQSLLDALAKYGSLTDKQLEAVRKCMARDAQREEARALASNAETGATNVRRELNAPVCDVTKLEEAFQKARDSARTDREGLKFLHLRLDTFVFTPAGARSRNPGAIYAKEEGEYLGKVAQGRFFRAGSCNDEQERRIVAAASDPAGAAKAYGLRTGVCSICGRELTKRESIDRGIGPICAARWGF